MNENEIQKEWAEGSLIAPPVNIYEIGDQFLLKANMPGVKKDNVTVKLREDQLIIYGKMEPLQDEFNQTIHQEFESGNFYRAFHVGENLDVKTIKAKYKDGILLVTLPKHKRLKSKEIPIEIV